MPPKRKQAPQPEAQLPSKRLRSQPIASPVEPPTRNDTTASRRDQLKSSPRKASKASVKADAFISNNETQDISDAASEPAEDERPLLKAQVTRVYGKASKARPRARKEVRHDTELQSPANEDLPVGRQLRSATATVEDVVVVAPAAKAPAKRSAKREPSTSTATTLKATVPAAEKPPKRTTRRTVAAVVEETDMMVDEPKPKAVPKRTIKRKTATTTVETETLTDAPIPKASKRRAIRRTRTTTVVDSDVEVPESILEVDRPTKSSEPPKTVTATGSSMLEELKTIDEAPLFSDVESTDEDASVTKPQSSPTAILAHIDVNSASARNASIPPDSVVPQIPQFNKASTILPVHLHSCFHVQKRSIMRTLQRPTCAVDESDLEDSANNVAAKQLGDLIEGSVGRAEGNSCLLLGPRGSGKSVMLENCLANLPNKPVIIRLSGWVQSTDRHAIREIAIQLLQQTGSALFSDIVKDPTNLSTDINQDDDNPFLDDRDESNEESGFCTMSLPPASHLHSLIPALLTLKRPVIVILDAFDLFALHPRQSLLYCLLDTVQNCRASSESRGIAVIGVTSRLDTIQLLEKRVKSRFSGRTIRTAPPNSLDSCLSYVRVSLQPSAPEDTSREQAEWNRLWSSHVDKFLADDGVLEVFKETYSVTRELKIVAHILTQSVLLLNLAHPYLSLRHLLLSADSQRSRAPNLHFDSLSYPAICLLIASVHLDTNGQSTFTFEMLFEIFRDQVRASQSVPVQVNGGSIGMVSCTRDIAMSAFESLIFAKIFIHISGPSANTSKEFMKYRCALDRGVIAKLVEQSGQTNLKRWHDRAK